MAFGHTAHRRYYHTVRVVVSHMSLVLVTLAMVAEDRRLRVTPVVDGGNINRRHNTLDAMFECCLQHAMAVGCRVNWYRHCWSMSVITLSPNGLASRHHCYDHHCHMRLYAGEVITMPGAYEGAAIAASGYALPAASLLSYAGYRHYCYHHRAITASTMLWLSLRLLQHYCSRCLARVTFAIRERVTATASSP